MSMHRPYNAWSFTTDRFSVVLRIEPDYGYVYDGDDEDGETQAKLDSGEYVAFDSDVCVYIDGVEIARETLGGSVYDADNVKEFWTAHRDANPMHRNCSIMRGKHGNVSIGHYFPDMVRQACAEARKAVAKFQSVHVRS